MLILDEPAAAPDPMGRLAVLRIMQRLRERATIFYSTHIPDDVQRLSGQPWISTLTIDTQDSVSEWRVDVSNDLRPACVCCDR